MRRPYSVLLPVGFTVPPPLPETRCALAAPFRPCLAEAAAVCFLWHCPWGHPRRALPGTVTLRSPDFPPARASTKPAAARPSGAAYIAQFQCSASRTLACRINIIIHVKNIEYDV